MDTKNLMYKDAFDQWSEWATSGRATNFSTLAPEIYNAVMTLTPEERIDRAIVNEAVRSQMSPLRPAGSADRYGVPRAEENAPVEEK
jgi:hypothetical protein